LRKKVIFLLATRFRLFLVCAFVVAGLAYAAAKPSEVFAQDELPVAVVVAYKGDVSLYRDGSEKKIPLRGSEGIYLKDTLITGLDSAVKILAKDDSLITLGANSSLKVSRYDVNKDGTQREVLLSLRGGVLRAIVHRAYNVEDSTFQVKTGAALVTVTGTDFIMSLDGEILDVAVIEGSVGVEGGGAQVKLDSGYIASVDFEGTLIGLEKFKAEKLQALLAMTELPVTMAFELALQGCQACHAETFKVVYDSAFTHSEAQECAMCHIKGALSVGGRDKNLQVSAYSRSNILFIATNRYSVYTASVRVMDDTGLEASSGKVEFMPLDEKELPDDGTGPVITGLKVKEVKSGIFLKTVIVWQTDEPALSKVEFGEKSDYGFSVKGNTHYVTDHSVVVDKFKPGKKYNLRAVSEDVFGNESVSESIRVKIDKSFIAEPDSEIMHEEIVLNGLDIVKVNGRIALRWSTDIKTMASIHLVEKINEGETDNKVVLKDKHAPGLRSDVGTGLLACLECHGGDVHMKASHPFGQVDWSKGAVKGKGLPLSVGSQIMCSTCHQPHGSSLSFMLRMNEEELCGACHRGSTQFGGSI
jgi:predicted CXXCH cytochrome family protein